MDKTELIVDSFAGGGGASLGIAWALGRGPDIAINHDSDAIRMHEANHPSTEHVLENVWRTDLLKLTKGRSVGLLWASPDCKHFSRSKGGKPVEKSIRSLAWIVCRWADQVRPRMIALENVREFADWGPLVPRWICTECGWKGTEGQAVLMRVRRKCPSCDSKRIKQTAELIPCPDRKGVTFKRFVGRLRNLGYHVEWRNLDAADFGAPTHRKRLFLIARCDGQPIEWPEPTHANPSKLDSMPLFGRLKPYRTAAECIDWTIPCPSIFGRPRPLAEKTMRRIALGIKRYVIDSSKPFIVQTSHTGTGKGCQNQIVVANLVYSFLVKYFGTAIGSSLVDPTPTSTGKDRFGLVTVVVKSEPYVIVDIGMRMLTPRELARAQGFPDTYVLTGTKTSQVARIGNSVCPQVAAAIVKANCLVDRAVKLGPRTTRAGLAEAEVE
jgi:DNA (cytosine-5)-methyltransferase 1